VARTAAASSSALARSTYVAVAGLRIRGKG
jgi:hypothetical protein